jgi:hypothetical protein
MKWKVSANSVEFAAAHSGDVLCSPSCGEVAVNCNLNHSPQVNHTVCTTNGAGSAKQSEDKTVIESMSCPKHLPCRRCARSTTHS